MRRALCLLSCVLATPALWCQGLEYVKAHYTKYEYEISMRDGKKLFTAVFAPKDVSHPYPILLTRTPYSVSPYGEDNYRASLGPGEIFAKDGFIFVYQDVRGRWMSEGEFADMRPIKDRKAGPADTDESTDTWCNESRSSPAPFSRYSLASSFSFLPDGVGNLSAGALKPGIGYAPV
jgi:hypothetical protein